jgi:hypothetical protein
MVIRVTEGHPETLSPDRHPSADNPLEDLSRLQETLEKIRLVRRSIAQNLLNEKRVMEAGEYLYSEAIVILWGVDLV